MNQAADALSRKHEQAELNAISTGIPKWTVDLIAGYQDDLVATQLITELSVTQSPKGKYTLQDGLLRYKGRVYVGTNKLAQQHIL